MFMKRNGVYDRVAFAIKPIDHQEIPTAIADPWMKTIQSIISGKMLETATFPWNGESKLNFLKAAILVSRENEVAEKYECAEHMNAAIAWARLYLINRVQTWMHTDEITIGACKLAFTLQKWEGNVNVACIESTITGEDMQSILQLTEVLRSVNQVGAGQAVCSTHDVVIRTAIFADQPNTYKSFPAVRTDAHRALAKKYKSKRMLELLAEPKVAQWTLMYGGKPSVMLTKHNGKVIGNDFGHTIDSVLTSRIAINDIAGGPQMWAEIAAFAGKDSPYHAVVNFAKRIGVPLDMDRITAASTAGKVASLS